MLSCAGCGRENPAGARFCNGCGAPLAAEAPAALEERKVVTVLFADVVGFTARAEAMDPEDVRRFLQPLHARLRSELERRGGTVEKFIGDAVMAIFGAPVVHEDDPERAVRAALAIVEALAKDGEVEVRIGITTGEALIALEARPEAGEGVASGDVVNTAARLQTAAPAGAILVDETTCRASGRAIDYAEVEPVVAKGKAEAVRAWRALRARTPVGAERARSAAFVGRVRERALLRDTLARVLGECEPQLVTLVGVPGIGKSRLVFEFLQDSERGPERVVWLHGRSLPYGEGVTFWALGEMVKAQAGILESDTPAQTEQKLHGAVTAAVADAAEAGRIERHLRPLAGLETEDIGAGDRSSEAFAAWRRFLEALAERRPLVLVFEDLHWADDALLDFVDHLLDWATGVPMLVLATARPELLARRSAWGGGTPNSATLRLSPLSDTETETLLWELLGSSMLAAETQRKLLERAGGNPLYAQEFARMLTDRGAELRLPESVQGIIAARLDSLPREEKELIQDAAVIGSVFWLGALGSERWRLEEALHSLERKEFVRRERASSVAGEAEYVFSHALARDVAYQQIPRSRRAEKHRGAAGWIESLGRTEDHAEMLAHHYREALDYADAAGEPAQLLHGRATRAFRAAGNRAFSLNAYPAASRYYEQALALGSDADGRGELLLSLGEAQARAGDMPTAKETFLAAADVARRAGSADQLARAALGYGGRFVWASASTDPAVIPLLERALAAVGEPDSRTRAMLLARLAAARRDDPGRERRVRLAEEAVEIAERIGDPVTLAAAVEGQWIALEGPEALARGDGVAQGEKLIALGEQIGDKERVFAGHDYRLQSFWVLGDRARMQVELEALGVLADELCQPAQQWHLSAVRTVLELMEGQFERAERLIAETLALGQRSASWNAVVSERMALFVVRRAQGRLAELGDTIGRSTHEYPALLRFGCALAHLYAELGRKGDARAAVDSLLSRDLGREHVDTEWCFSVSLLPDPCAFLGDEDAAAKLYSLLLPYEHVYALAPLETLFGSLARGLGVLATTLGQFDDAERHFEVAIETERRMHARPWLAHAQHDLATMLLARGAAEDRDRAHALLGEAAATYRELGMPTWVSRATALA